MRRFIFIPLNLILLSAPLFAVAQDKQSDWKYIRPMMSAEHEDWLKCESDNQCKLIPVRVVTCVALIAANKKHADQAYKDASQDISKGCDAMMVYPPDITAKCIANECILAFHRQ